MVSTTENLSVVIWRSVSEELAAFKNSSPDLTDVQLFEIKIHETDKNIVVYRGD